MRRLVGLHCISTRANNPLIICQSAHYSHKVIYARAVASSRGFHEVNRHRRSRFCRHTSIFPNAYYYFTSGDRLSDGRKQSVSRPKLHFSLYITI